MSETERQRPWWLLVPPAPPLWTLIPAVLADLGTAAWRVISAGGGAGVGLFLRGLMWPGVAIAAVVFAVVWLAWSVELDN